MAKLQKGGGMKLAGSSDSDLGSGHVVYPIELRIWFGTSTEGSRKLLLQPVREFREVEDPLAHVERIDYEICGHTLLESRRHVADIYVWFYDAALVHYKMTQAVFEGITKWIHETLLWARDSSPQWQALLLDPARESRWMVTDMLNAMLLRKQMGDEAVLVKAQDLVRKENFDETKLLEVRCPAEVVTDQRRPFEEAKGAF